MARYAEAIADGPAATGGGLRARGLDGGPGLDGDGVEERGGVGGAATAGGDMGFEGDILAVFSGDVDAAVHGVDSEAAVGEREGGGAELAGPVAAAEPMGDHAAAVGVVLARLGGERLRVEAGGGEQNGAEGEGVAAELGPALRFAWSVYAGCRGAVPCPGLVADAAVAGAVFGRFVAAHEDKVGEVVPSVVDGRGEQQQHDGGEGEEGFTRVKAGAEGGCGEAKIVESREEDAEEPVLEDRFIGGLAHAPRDNENVGDAADTRRDPDDGRDTEAIPGA